MLSLTHINTIAHYEAKTLFRSWFFRIFGALMLLILFFFNIEQIKSNQVMLAVPSTIPYTSVLFFSLVQSIVAIFLASDFLRRDKKLDTTEVVYTRSMSNGDYILGKLVGNLKVFTVFNFVVLGMVLLINIISPNHQVCFQAYIYYFLLISLPSLLFIIGLSFVLMNILRNQAITFAILLGYVFLTLFYLQHQYFYLFDFMAYNIPMAYSDFIGFTSPERIIAHRAIYGFLGLSFISFTVFRLWRLPNKPFTRIYPLIISIVFLVVSAVLGYFYIKNAGYGESLRKEMIALNNKYADLPQLSIINQHLVLNHTDDQISVKSTILVKNKEVRPTSQILLRLNPGLSVSGVTVLGKKVTYRRDHHLLFVDIRKPLSRGDSTQVTIDYSGKIDQEACYLDIDETLRSKKKSDNFVNVGEIYACIQSRYLFLTPESNWYPLANVGYNQKNTRWILPQFSTYSLTIKSFSGAKILVPGAAQNGSTSYNTHSPLTGLSIVAGPYEKQSYEKHSPEIGVWLKPGHDFYKSIFTELKDTAEGVIYKTFQDFSLRNGGDYPFSSLFLVEVPLQVYAYPRYWQNHTEVVQPSVVFIPERGGMVREFRFKQNMENSKQWGNSKDLDSLSLQVEELKKFLDLFFKVGSRNRIRYTGNQIVEDEVNNPYFVFDQFYGLNHPVVSEQYPIFTPLLGSYLSRKGQPNEKEVFSYGFSENEKAALLLKEKSVSDIVSNSVYNKLADNVMAMKGDALFSLLEQRVGRLNLEDILSSIRKSHRCQPVEFAELKKLILEKSGQDIDDLLANWLVTKQLPGYRIGQVETMKVKDGQRLRFLTRLSIGNESLIDGIVKVAVRETGSDNSNDNEGVSFKTYVVGAGRKKTISILTDKQPAAVILNTNASLNIPVRRELAVPNLINLSSVAPSEAEVDDHLDSWDDNSVIVDNEDKGFTVVDAQTKGLLRKLAQRFETPGDEYQGYDSWIVGGNWGKYMGDIFYGKYIYSGTAIRSGGGVAKATWSLPLTKKGQYDIYAFIAKESGKQDEAVTGEFHYSVYHDDGVDKVVINTQQVDAGWVLLGTYYCTPGSAKVVLSNESNSKIVIADAVKAVPL